MMLRQDGSQEKETSLLTSTSAPLAGEVIKPPELHAGNDFERLDTFATGG